MSGFEHVKEKIIEMITAEKNHRLRPYTVVRSLSEELGAPIFWVQVALGDLIRDRTLVLTYRNFQQYVEFSSNRSSGEARPMKVVVNGKGDPWICAHDVDPSKDLGEQGCWQLEQEDAKQIS